LAIDGGHGANGLQVCLDTLEIGHVFAHVVAKGSIGGFRGFVLIGKLEHVLDRVATIVFDGHQMGIDPEHVLVEALADQDVLVNLPKVKSGHEQEIHEFVHRHGRQIGQRFSDEMVACHVLQDVLVDTKGDGDAAEFEDQKGKEQEQKGHDEGNDGGHHVGDGQDLQNRRRLVEEFEPIPFDEAILF